jgi:molybdate transport system substrate-binding protein
VNGRVLRRLGAASGLVLVAACAAGCGSRGDTSGGADERTLTVFAASSLTSAFTVLGKEFESAHPGVKVTFDFAGSSDLVAQLQQGAPADVFASADTANMDKATSDDLVEGNPVDFATNTLEIATPPDNPARVKSFQDLGEPGTKVVVCAPEVPCGAATEAVEKSAGVTLEPVSEEQSVTDVLAKVTSGEADAGVVYVTDVIGAGKAVQGVPFPESSDAVNTYPIAQLADAKEPGPAKQFLELVTGSQGRRVLERAGFGRP